MTDREYVVAWLAVRTPLVSGYVRPKYERQLEEARKHLEAHREELKGLEDSMRKKESKPFYAPSLGRKISYGEILDLNYNDVLELTGIDRDKIERLQGILGVKADR